MFEPLPNLNPEYPQEGRPLCPPSVPPEFLQSQWPTNDWVAFERQWANNPVPLALSDCTAGVGIDLQAAFNHLLSLHRSWGLPFEDRVSNVAYLASLWFTRLTYMGVTYPTMVAEAS